MMRLSRNAKKICINVSAKKSEILRINSWDDREVIIEGQVLKNCKKFTYLGSIVSESGGTLTRTGNRYQA
jgi:hypothetical protein